MQMTLQEIMDTTTNWNKFCDMKGFDVYAVNEGNGHVTVKLDLYEAHILGIITLRRYQADKYSKKCPYCHESIPKLAKTCYVCKRIY